jgi:triosephosphate isomerase
VPTTEQIAQAHEFMRTTLLVSHGSTGQDMRLLYGGSVKGSNANDIFAVANVDGALVGGASLTAADFGPIITALEQA